MAWLLEKYGGTQTKYISLDTGIFDWSPDVQAAFRMSRREDAEALVAIIEEADCVAEHLWTDE